MSAAAMEWHTNSATDRPGPSTESPSPPPPSAAAAITAAAAAAIGRLGLGILAVVEKREHDLRVDLRRRQWAAGKKVAHRVGVPHPGQSAVGHRTRRRPRRHGRNFGGGDFGASSASSCSSNIVVGGIGVGAARRLLRRRCAWSARSIAPQFSQRLRHIDLSSTRAPCNRCRQASSSA